MIILDKKFVTMRDISAWNEWRSKFSPIAYSKMRYHQDRLSGRLWGLEFDTLEDEVAFKLKFGI